MTTAQPQAVRTKGLILIAVMPLLGCVASSKSVYRVDGAVTDFCVPLAIDVTPARPDEGKVIMGGFTINGCWRSEWGQCVGPESLIALSVSDKESFVGRRYEDFPSDAHVGTTANQERKHAKLLDDKLIAIPDSADAQKWFVWSVVDTREQTMADDDELEVTCIEKSDADGYFCDRKVAGRDYLLGYSFFSQNEMPTTFKLLDRQVVEDIEKLRCHKAQSG